uniref:Uncharacterized protein n=1 Tax=Anguilla anguilla TaxID=7936 RepID=A0A0E9SDH6_ANGAN
MLGVIVLLNVEAFDWISGFCSLENSPCCYCQQPRKSVHLNLMFIVLFQIYCAGVQRQNNRNCVTVPRLFTT